MVVGRAVGHSGASSLAVGSHGSWLAGGLASVVPSGTGNLCGVAGVERPCQGLGSDRHCRVLAADDLPGVGPFDWPCCPVAAHGDDKRDDLAARPPGGHSDANVEDVSRLFRSCFEDVGQIEDVSRTNRGCFEEVFSAPDGLTDPRARHHARRGCFGDVSEDVSRTFPDATPDARRCARTPSHHARQLRAGAANMALSPVQGAEDPKLVGGVANCCWQLTVPWAEPICWAVGSGARGPWVGRVGRSVERVLGVGRVGQGAFGRRARRLGLGHGSVGRSVGRGILLWASRRRAWGHASGARRLGLGMGRSGGAS